jgi:hypothetical protein
MSSLINEIKNVLDGTEILSLRFEGCVAIKGNEVWQGGKIIKKLHTKKEWTELLDDAFYDEFGTSDVSKVI